MYFKYLAAIAILYLACLFKHLFSQFSEWNLQELFIVLSETTYKNIVRDICSLQLKSNVVWPSWISPTFNGTWTALTFSVLVAIDLVTGVRNVLKQMNICIRSDSIIALNFKVCNLKYFIITTFVSKNVTHHWIWRSSVVYIKFQVPLPKFELSKTK